MATGRGRAGALSSTTRLKALLRRRMSAHQALRSAPGGRITQSRPLSPASRTAYAQSWEQTQAGFVDDPAGSLSQADALIIAVMEERGYPMDDFERRADDISVDHPDVVQHYRAAHDISIRLGDDSGAAPGSTTTRVSTEDMRQGLVHYRALFRELLEPDQDEPTRDRATG